MITLIVGFIICYMSLMLLIALSIKGVISFLELIEQFDEWVERKTKA